MAFRGESKAFSPFTWHKYSKASVNRFAGFRNPFLETRWIKVSIIILYRVRKEEMESLLKGS